MKTYDLIAIGTGSAMNIVAAVLQADPDARIAVIDKDPPGGICLTKGCIPTKLLLYPAEMIRSLDKARDFGLDIRIHGIDFKKIMKRMRRSVRPEIASIQKSLERADAVDYYPETAEFTGPRQLTVAGDRIESERILLCTGSRPHIAPIRGLDSIDYHTSDTILDIDRLPKSIAIVGGGYIAAEYGHFFSAMGSTVTIIGRNARFLPDEEPEVSALAAKVMGRHMTVLTDHEVESVAPARGGACTLTARDRTSGKVRTLTAAKMLLATGRASNADLLHPERSGIETDENGWIVVDPYLQTSSPGVWAMGDAVGRHLFKHVANYESTVVYHNAFFDEKRRVDYRAIPHAVFTHPEIAAVGIGEGEAVSRDGEGAVLIGFHRFRDTAKGEAMGLEEDFVKLIVERDRGKILGAHIIGCQASVLVQELVTVMYSGTPTILPITDGMHIHPALGEVVERAAGNLMPPSEYHQLMESGKL